MNGTPEVMYAIPSPILMLALLVTMGLAIYIGTRMGKNRASRTSEEGRAQVSALQGSLLGLLALLLTARFIFWKPQLAMRRLELGIMYLGYIGIVLQLLIEALGAFAAPHWVGALSVHVFGLGVMGLIIPAMLIRIARGHTGRKVAFDGVDKLVLWIMIFAFVLRVIAPQIDAAAYSLWILLAACGWLCGFTILALRLIPLLLKARVDGKEH